ncbi:hypothetical protein L9F63_004168, partial [Diploptera punctata]
MVIYLTLKQGLVIAFIPFIGTKQEFEDAVLKAPDLIKKYGYPVEKHEVETQDGYLLTLHRIPPLDYVKPPVLLLHGLMSDSADFIIIGPRNAIGYLLSDAGYDVWLGNSRGNTYSRNHKYYIPESREFWEFSWHEVGVYDLPAMIDYILNVTSWRNLYYIGYSQGTTAFYVMASELPQYNKKVRLKINLAPVVFMSNIRSPVLKLFSPFSFYLKDLWSLLGGFELRSQSYLMSEILRIFCRDGVITQPLCYTIRFLITGYSYDQLNTTALPVIMSHTPAGASTLQCLHYAQLVYTGRFCQFDHGWKNYWIYQQYTPPDYNLENVTTPVVLMYSTNDWLSDVKDVDKLEEILPNVVLKYEIPNPMFSHPDYTYGKDVRSLVYEKILELL